MDGDLTDTRCLGRGRGRRGGEAAWITWSETVRDEIRRSACLVLRSYNY